MKNVYLTILSIVIFSISTFAFAADKDTIAQVIVSVGEVEAVSKDAIPRNLSRRDKVYEHDTIKTGDASQAKLRFNDNTLLTLYPNSEFTVEEYEFNQPGSDKNEYFGKLVKGGFMVVTGAVANKENANFKVNSQLIDLSVRGTCFGGKISSNFQFGVTNCGAVQVDNEYGSVLIGPDMPKSLVVSGENGSLLTAQDQTQVDKFAQCRFN